MGRGLAGAMKNWTVAYEYAYSYLDPGRRERQWRLRSLLAPLSVFSLVPYKDTNFPLRPSSRWRGGKLKHPWVSLNQTDRKWSCENPCPHGDSHEFPQFHWPVGWLLIQRCATVLPLNAAHKGTRGGRRAKWERREKKIIIHSPSQHDPDNSRLPFLVGTKLALCPKLQERKRNKKPNEKGVLQRLIRYKQDQSVPSLRNRRKSISFLFPSFFFYVWP